MNKLKDVTLNLKGVNDDMIHRLFDIAQAFELEFDLYVTDGGYDVVTQDSSEKEGPVENTANPLVKIDTFNPESPTFKGPISQSQLDWLFGRDGRR